MQQDWIQEKELERLAKAKAWPGFAPLQQAAVERVDALLVIKGARPATRLRFASKARLLARFLDKPFEKATRENLAQFFTHIARTHTPEGVRYVKSFVRRFYTLLLSPYDEKLPKVVSWISAKKLRADHNKPLPVLKPEDIRELLRATTCIRDRALISVLYESGARISELCGLTLGDVVFDEYGARITVDGKTGVRRVRLIQCVPDLRDWINQHPFGARHEVPLFVSQHSRRVPKPLFQNGVRFILRAVANRAGIRKRVNPHSFRKARATELAKSLTPSELSVYHGWVQGSAMPQVYIHLTGDDVEQKILRQAGVLKEKKNEPNPLQPQTCPRCVMVNAAASVYCARCTLPLDEGKRRRMSTDYEALEKKIPLLLKLLEDPDVRKLWAQKTSGTAAA